MNLTQNHTISNIHHSFNYALLNDDYNLAGPPRVKRGYGDGYFSKKQLIIVFSNPDIILAEYLKTRLNAGNFYKIKNKNAFTFVIYDKNTLE